jgi:2-desacetyl-2-hydroxyethyl bacteriochlorophyllide A dehydrogenase
MKAVRLVKIGQPLQMQEVPLPTVGEHDVLVRIKAAGICHSDVHYRAGISPVKPLPMTPGHEVAGLVEQTGSQVTGLQVGDRVCLHYLVTCGNCAYCTTGNEHFCVNGRMIGKHLDGGYAEYIAVPARNAIPVPDNVALEHAAVMMCSSATSLHALGKACLKAGETVAIFGAGGLGMSAIQLARNLGARDVYAVDINADKLQVAAQYGAIPVNAAQGDPVAEIQRLTGRRGVDVAVELIGLPQTMRQAVQSLAIFGRAVWVGITDRPVTLDSYHEVLGKEAEIIGSDDHLLPELHALLEYARRGLLDLSQVVTRSVPLDASAINEMMDNLEHYRADVRAVIVP